MARFKYLLIFFLSLVLTSCSTEEEDASSGFPVTVDQQTILIPVGQSGVVEDCQGKDHTGNRFSFANLRMSWDQFDRDLMIIYMKISFDHPNLGGQVNFIIAGEDLDGRLYYDTESADTIIRNGVVPAPTQGNQRIIANRSNCRLFVGGIDISNEEQNFEVVGRVEIQGVATGNNAGQEAGTVVKGDEVSVRGTTSFRLIYNIN